MKYKLTERAYINDLVLEPDTLLGDGTGQPYAGEPGPHLEPMDDEAKAATAAWRKAHPGATLDVMSTLPLHEKPHRPLTAEDMLIAMKAQGEAFGSQLAQALAALVPQGKNTLSLPAKG